METTRVSQTPAGKASRLRIEDGSAYVWFAYDLGRHIDLDRAHQRFVASAEREQIRHQQRAPSYLRFEPAPLRLLEAAAPIVMGATATDGQVESTLYDFGAVSIAYRIAIDGRGLDELQALAQTLDENPLLLADSRRHVLALMARLGDALQEAQLADLVENYTVFHARRWSPDSDPAQLVHQHGDALARILRCESEPLRADEVQDALQFRIAYGLEDDLVIDWNGAFLFEQQGEDTLAVLEFANVELLEMRFLDGRLDHALDRSHDMLRRRRGRAWRPWLGDASERMRKIGNLQIDAAILFESVNNAIKLVGDQFLARVYRLAARRFHLDEWDASILRKIETIESIYEKLSNEHANTRIEVLEWIIIALFLLDIALPFLLAAAS